MLSCNLALKPYLLVLLCMGNPKNPTVISSPSMTTSQPTADTIFSKDLTFLTGGLHKSFTSHLYITHILISLSSCFVIFSTSTSLVWLLPPWLVDAPSIVRSLPLLLYPAWVLEAQSAKIYCHLCLQALLPHMPCSYCVHWDQLVLHWIGYPHPGLFHHARVDISGGH